VRSPLAELGWTKARVREAARELGIPTWDAPASPCLASRIRYGLEVTATRLRQVEQAEQLLRGLGVTGDLRVRHLDRVASIETEPAWHGMLRTNWTTVVAGLERLGFAEVVLHPGGYRRGSLLPAAGE